MNHSQRKAECKTIYFVHISAWFVASGAESDCTNCVEMVISIVKKKTWKQSERYIRSKQSKDWKILSWEEFGEFIADQNQNFTATKWAADLKQCTYMRQKNGAHFFSSAGRRIIIAKRMRCKARATVNTALQTSRLSSETGLIVEEKFQWIVFRFWPHV